MDEIPYSAEVSAMGRNGTIRMAGLAITKVGNELVLQPITSKGAVGNSSQSIPLQDLEKVIKALRAAAK